MQVAGDILLLLVAVASVAAVSVCPGEGGRYDNDNNDLSNNDNNDLSNNDNNDLYDNDVNDNDM